MPVRKTAAKKPTAKKSAAPALAKKVASAKTTKKSAASASNVTTKPDNMADFKRLANGVAKAIREGLLDGELGNLDDALTERANSLATQDAARKTTKTAEKKTTAPPKRTTTTKVTLTPGKEYKVSPSFKKLAGAKVEFVRFKVVDGKTDKEKAVVVMKTDKPGNPKGKRIVIAVGALV